MKFEIITLQLTEIRYHNIIDIAVPSCLGLFKFLLSRHSATLAAAKSYENEEV
jgi:hypothetical protein